MRFLRAERLMVLVMATALTGFAQRGTGGGSGHGGAHGSGQGVSRPANVLRLPGPNTGGKPYPIRSDIAPPTGLIPPAAAYTGISPGGLRTIGGGGRSRYPIVPVFAPPIYYPGFYDSPFSSNVAPYNDQSGDAAASSAVLANQDAMADQIRQLSSELERMRSSPPQQLQPEMTPAQGPGGAVDSTPPAEQIPIQIVLRNGQQFPVKSYAVMNGTLWDFSSSRARRISVSSVDVAASTKATEAAGGEFPSLSNK